MVSASPGDVIDLAPATWTNQIVWSLSGVTLRARDGSVNVNDLLLAISNWGSHNPDADVDNVGMIGINDHLSVTPHGATSAVDAAQARRP